MISVLILTKNEEVNIRCCIDAVAWSDDVVVFDSFSDDRTVEIARQAGARVFQRAFDSYGRQREAARTTVSYKHPWVLSIDADERPDSQMVIEMQQIAMKESRHAAFRMRRKDYFLGKWVRRSTLYPSWFVRFYRHDRISYPPRGVHEYPQVQGSVGELQGHLLHDPLSKGLAEWWAKHARYAELEAREAVRARVDAKGIVSLDPVRRRRALKALSTRLPFRPTLRFLYMYLLRGGWMDGAEGYEYCRLLQTYERLIVLNERMMRARSEDDRK